MPNSEPKKLFDTQKLEVAVADLLIPEITDQDAADPVAIGNKIIRGLNQNTIATVKTQHGVENLHSRVTPLEKDVESLMERNQIIDEYMAKIVSFFDWVRSALGTWLLMILKLIFWGLAALIVSKLFGHFHLHFPWETLESVQ